MRGGREGERVGWSISSLITTRSQPGHDPTTIAVLRNEVRPREVCSGVMTKQRLSLTALSLAASLALFAGCGVGSSAPGGFPQPAATMAAEGQPEDRSGGGAVPEAPTDPAAERQVARTGSISVSVTDVLAAAQQLRVLAESAGGLVTAENIVTTAAGSTASSRVVVAVPSDALGATMDAIAKLGELRTRTVTATDVTTQVVDVEARIKTLRESIERIRALMDRTGSIGDIARVESELTQRQSELEAMLAEQKSLKDRVALAPITVTLLAPGQVTTANPLWDGLVDGWEAMIASVAALLRLVGALVPFVALLALVAAPLLWWRRRMRARPGVSTPPAQPEAPTQPAQPVATPQAPETPQPPPEGGASDQ